jgi:hypothetical protein
LEKQLGDRIEGFGKVYCQQAAWLRGEGFALLGAAAPRDAFHLAGVQIGAEKGGELDLDDFRYEPCGNVAHRDSSCLGETI